MGMGVHAGPGSPETSGIQAPIPESPKGPSLGPEHSISPAREQSPSPDALPEASAFGLELGGQG